MSAGSFPETAAGRAYTEWRTNEGDDDYDNDDYEYDDDVNGDDDDDNE